MTTTIRQKLHRDRRREADNAVDRLAVIADRIEHDEMDRQTLAALDRVADEITAESRP